MQPKKKKKIAAMIQGSFHMLYNILMFIAKKKLILYHS